MAENVLMEKTAGLPNLVWAGVAVAGFFVLQRFIGSGSAATPPAGTGGTGGTGGPPGVGPCPTVTPVQCGSGFQQQAGVDNNGCPTLSCVPIGTGTGGCKFYTVYTVSSTESLNDVAYAFNLSIAHLFALNPYLDSSKVYTAGAYAGHDIIVDSCLRGT